MMKNMMCYYTFLFYYDSSFYVFGDVWFWFVWMSKYLVLNAMVILLLTELWSL